MRKLLVFFVIFLSYSATAQTPQPEIVRLNSIGGSGNDDIFKHVTATGDGGFIVGISSGSDPGTGNIDSFCSASGNKGIFLKYNSNASIIEWTKCFQYDGDTFLIHLYPQNDGGTVLGGRYISSGIYICKQDALGNIIWSHGYSKGSSLGLTCMTATDDGGYIIGGGSFYIDTNVLVHYGSWVYSDIFILKLDSFGNKSWTTVLGGTNDDYVRQILQIPGQGYYVIGGTSSNDFDCTGNHGSGDGYVAKLGLNGNLLWHKDIGGSLYDGFRSAIPNNSGGITVSGSAQSIDGNVTHHVGTGMNAWLVNIDSNGNITWDSSYGGGSICYPNSMCRAVDGSIWLAGVSSDGYGQIDTVYGRDDAWFIHTDSVGSLINAKVVGSNNDDRAMMVYPLLNGQVIGGGFYGAANGTFSVPFYGDIDAFLIEFTPWTTAINEPYLNNQAKIYPNPANDQLHIEFEKSGNYSVAVTDIVGKEILKTFSVNAVQIDISKWQKGIYCIHIGSDKGYLQVHKFIVQ